MDKLNEKFNEIFKGEGHLSGATAGQPVESPDRMDRETRLRRRAERRARGTNVYAIERPFGREDE